MRFLLISLLSISTLAQARNLSLECVIRYDIDNKDKVEVPLIEAENASHFFSIENEKVYTYFFSENERGAQWHMDATYTINALIEEDTLVLGYNFQNYLRERTNLVTVFDETREFKIDFNEIDNDEEQTFDFHDGEVLESEINKDDWINESGAKLDECTIFDVDLVRAKEEGNRAESKPASRLTRFFRRVFND